MNPAADVLILNPRSGFTGATIDRADALRQDPEALAAARADGAARLVRMDGLEPVVVEDRLSRVPLSDAPPGSDLILLGLDDGVPTFVAFTGAAIAQRGPARIFSLMPLLPASEVALYAAARALLDWHGRHRFCANCGSPTAIFRAGWGRKCGACSAEHFPRVDPVVIMLAEHRGRVLLGRQPRFPPNRYSALAGFLEPGEAIEEAVARELKEEAGVRAIRVRYVASQPWPFPSSLMIACIAEVADDALVIDYEELEDAIWVDRAEVEAAMAGAPEARFLPPPTYAIAHTLLATWLESTARAPG
jgi:NAD+ diphosphatase